MQLVHPFEPIFDKSSRILILGTFPSVKSREYGFYYGHPQNRFWKIIAHITDICSIPQTISDKKLVLLANKIALSDVLQSCDIDGSSDSSIRSAVPADLYKILNIANINHIYANGEKAHRLLLKYFTKIPKQAITKLPSTSPANAKCSLNQLLLEWKKIAL
jgi:hypoxanthine-DNA glycosylase